MPVYSLTEEKLNELLDKIRKAKSDLGVLKETTIEQLWLNDLENIKCKISLA